LTAQVSVVARSAIASKEAVHISPAPALATASAKDREFLHAMSTDDGPSTTADIIHRTGSRPTLVAKYRNRLIDAGLIESTGHGKVDYAIPGLREYLRKNPGS
jgi:predicted MarR family transcription regulator